MNSPDSLRLDADLARMLSAYDQGIGDADGEAPTLNIQELPPEVRGYLEDANASAPASTAPPLPTGLDAPSPAEAFSADPSPPIHRVGRFELRRQLGKGGCGIVFLAFDPKLYREVALKIPRPEMLLSHDARRRLFREALAAAEFDHPNLVPVYETGEIGPVCFIASAFCPGETLADWLHRQSFPVPMRQAARLVAILAEAIQHAHNRNVLHRDMKPNNVLLQRVKTDPADQEPPPGSCVLRGETFIPRVVDFGLAKVAERGPSETGTRQILGTPKYMAPEQAQARHDEIGPRADVYALGVILYELLTGRAPYEGQSDVEVLRQSIEGRLTPPRTLRADIPRDLEAITLKAMSRSPARRYATAVDFADDLRRFLGGLPTFARPLGRRARAIKWFRRNDQAVAFFFVAVIALFFVFIGTWSVYQSRQLKDDREIALKFQATSRQQDRDREYAQRVRNAFQFWKAGDALQMAESLAAARALAVAAVEPPCVALDVVSRLGMVERRSLTSRFGPALTLAVGPKGDIWATGHADGTLALWDSATGEVTASTRAANGPLRHIAFVDDGRRVVTASSIRQVRVWQRTPGTLSEAFTLATPGLVTCLAETPDHRYVYLGTSEGACLKLSGKSATDVASWSLAPKEGLSALAVSPDGKSLVAAQAGGTVRLWHTETGREDRELPAAAGAALLAFVPRGGEGWDLAVVRKDENIVRLIAPEGREIGTFSSQSEWIVSLRASADGQFLATSGLDSAICLWDARTRTLQTMLRGHAMPLTDLRFSPDGPSLLSASEDGQLKVWNVHDDPAGPIVRDQPGILTAAHFQPESGRFALAFSDGTVVRQSARSLQERAIIPAGKRLAVRSLGYPAAAPPLGVELRPDVVTCWEFRDKPHRQFQIQVPPEARFTAAELSEDGRHLAVGTDRGVVTVWSLAEKAVIGTFRVESVAPVRFLALADDGLEVVTRLSSQMLGIWSTPDGTFQSQLPERGTGPCQVRFLPFSDRLAVAGRGSAIRICERDGRERSTLIGHTGRITRLAPSPDGRVLVSGSSTGEVKFWDVRTGQEIFGMRRHAGPVHVIEFSAEGRWLLTGGASPHGKGEYALWNTGDR